ncbi:MAG: CPBP family intramembrane metalloprotease [Methanobrevibacter sp.]|nr:CPBP family intramembrane metalloprotease [Methanobrevibacter sp.]
MTEKNKISEFITFPKTFDTYKWYKPIIIFIIAAILTIILQLLVSAIFTMVFGGDVIDSILNGGYESLNTPLGEIITDLSVIIMIPALYVANKIVKYVPSSAFISSRGGWNFKLYFKALVVPFILYIIFEVISFLVNGPQGTPNFSVGFFILPLILVPLQCIAEEYVFRGFVMPAFGSWFNIPILAIILQSVLFTVLHGNNAMGLISIFVSGVIFGILAWKTNGIEVSSALHTVNNLMMSFTVMFGLDLATSTIKFDDFVISIVFNIIVFAVVYYVGNRTNWYGEL